MMLKIMIVLLVLDEEVITFKLHSHGRLLARLVARNLQMDEGEGVCRRCETKLKQFRPHLELERFFAPKLVKTKEKKGLRTCWDPVL